MRFRFNCLLPAKGTVFFYFPGKVRFFAFLRNFEWMNEKAVFFFPVCFFFRQKIRMNEWHLNFSVEKKKNKKTHKNSEKKIQATFIKKKGNFIKIWMNDRWTFPRKKKKQLYFFFPLRGKKNTRFSNLNEWMTNVHARGKEKCDSFDWYETCIVLGWKYGYVDFPFNYFVFRLTNE